MISKYKILLVDDDPITNELNKMLIKDINPTSDIEIAYNGEEALDLLKTNFINASTPDIILLDINMPVMNGFEFLDELVSKYPEQLYNIKIYILSSSTNKTDKDKAAAYNIEGYISKPLSELTFKNIFQKN